MRRLSGSFPAAAGRAGRGIGTSLGLAVLPILVGDALRALTRLNKLFAHGITMQPIIHPAVPESASRLRFFLTLTELGIDVTAMTPGERVVILHEHAVIDHRGHASIEALKREMRAVWPGDRRVHVARLHDEGTVRENLGRLAGYATKIQERYSVAWDGRRTSYLKDYEPEWRTFVRDLYERIGFARVLSTNLTVQSAAPRTNRRMHTEHPLRTAEYSRLQPIQLYAVDDVIGRITRSPHGNIETNTLH